MDQFGVFNAQCEVRRRQAMTTTCQTNPKTMTSSFLNTCDRNQVEELRHPLLMNPLPLERKFFPKQ